MWKFNSIRNTILCFLGFHKWIRQVDSRGEVLIWCKRGYHEIEDKYE